MNKKVILAIIGALLIIVSISGNFVKVGHMEETGWENSTYAFWYFMIAWGVLYCALLFYKKLMPQQHPVLWLIGIIPLGAGLYIWAMVEGIL